MVNLGTRCNNIVLLFLCGGDVGSVSAHVSLVGGSGSRQMIFDKCWREHGMVVSSSLRWRIPRSVADGGEHMHWWMYLAYSAADDVASTLATMAKVGSVVGSLRTVGGLAAWVWVP